VCIVSNVPPNSSSNKIKEDEIGGACSTRGVEKCVKNLGVEGFKGRDHSEGVEGRRRSWR
jgi:hypothetical protein